MLPIYLVIFAIFFPIYIPFAGRDALTTGTACVFLFFIYTLISGLIKKNLVVEKIDFLVYLLICVASVSSVFFPPSDVLREHTYGHLIRQYVSLVSSLLFFLTLKNYCLAHSRKASVSNVIMFEHILSVYIILTCVHVIIAYIVKYLPDFQSAFVLFAPRETGQLGVASSGRIRSFVFTYECMAETLAALCPLVVYKIMKSRNFLWLVCLLIFALGELYTITRSGILLFSIGLFCSILYHLRSNLSKSSVLIYIIVLVSSILAYLSLDIFSSVATRFTMAINDYQKTGDIIYSINRGGFYDIFHYISTNATFFGHSLARIDFHNLFFTTFHQLGIVGALLFFVLFLYPGLILLRCVLRKGTRNPELIFSCFLCIVLFVVNETKFEFTRHASYQQIWFGILSAFYLIATYEIEMTTENRPSVTTKI